MKEYEEPVAPTHDSRPTSHDSIQGIDHVQITIPVGQEQVARAFYCGVLGLLEIEKPGTLADRGGVWLAIGNQQLHIGVEDGIDRSLTKAHIAYRVENVAEWHARLEAAGCLVLESVPILGFDRFETRDPFGNRIEFIASRVTES